MEEEITVDELNRRIDFAVKKAEYYEALMLSEKTELENLKKKNRVAFVIGHVYNFKTDLRDGGRALGMWLAVDIDSKYTFISPYGSQKTAFATSMMKMDNYLSEFETEDLGPCAGFECKGVKT